MKSKRISIGWALPVRKKKGPKGPSENAPKKRRNHDSTSDSPSPKHLPSDITQIKCQSQAGLSLGNVLRYLSNLSFLIWAFIRVNVRIGIRLRLNKKWLERFFCVCLSILLALFLCKCGKDSEHGKSNVNQNPVSQPGKKGVRSRDSDQGHPITIRHKVVNSYGVPQSGKRITTFNPDSLLYLNTVYTDANGFANFYPPQYGLYYSAVYPTEASYYLVSIFCAQPVVQVTDTIP